MYKKHRASICEPIAARKPEGAEREPAVIPGTHDPRKLTDKQLKFYFCADGPGRCEKCRLCAYGREYARRAKEHGSEE